ncbi:histidine kinase-, DNA gyrase B-, and HSP90-like ATPase family protein [Asticcacaulis biprosthecium C19]|uniref:histidine kinase n=1 Tax=Asticcacaulis biprosthecium C19 TaxID=715226 RepID=F4QNX9_9CAUL|nr:HAMP domain-containing sensor histidine kinase [Asticcacaulis biprosthecium]EGF91037.1 histidine kinase-, DNA gyrase B-, and HSP90-like ATPase family protein [Asticcacaulis biprosthecium C19]
MQLVDFIRGNTAPIIADWESYAQSMVPAGDHMGPLAIRDHIHQILDFIVCDIESAQTERQRTDKSHGAGADAHHPSAAEIHASLRYDGGFNMAQMVSEYRALRASVTKRWLASAPIITAEHVDALVRFNEAIDQALTESIRDYSQKMDLSRNLFLGILSHDLRNPLGAISMSAQLTLKLGALSETQTILQSQVVDSAHRASEIVDNLLDLTRARLGSGLPIVRQPMDMGHLAHRLVDEMRVLHPKREFALKVTGDLSGDWDKARIGQVFSNLIGNAVQYGFMGTPITIRVEGLAQTVAVSVHNEGVPIASAAQRTIFNALTRAPSTAPTATQSASTNLGLGLYITKEIVEAHGGTIAFTSTETDGTVFRISFPRLADGVSV